LRIKLNIIFSPFQHKCMALWWTLLWIICSAWEHDFKGWGRTLWTASLIAHSIWDLLTCPWTSYGFLWKKSILPFTGKQYTYCCNSRLLTRVN
jgi:hypothetical protein